MDYTDRIYGKEEISEPVVLELLVSPVMQRLKKVNQFGYMPGYAPAPKGGFTKGENNRLEHSIGVYLLLRRYGASLEEQIAGLLHDVSHTVFSHSADYALRSGEEAANQDHQDNIFEAFLKNSDIPSVLSKYGLDIDYISDDNNFPLKEKKIPDLCADRIDYFLRDGFLFGVLDEIDIKEFLEHLFIEKDLWFFDNFRVAKECAKIFFGLNNKYYAGFGSARMFASVGDCLKYCLEKEYLTKQDFFTTDNEVVKKIENRLDDEKLRDLFARMNNQVEAINDPQNFDQKVICKSRAVDPFFRDGKKIRRVSEVDAAWAAALPEELKPKEYFIRFARNPR